MSKNKQKILRNLSFLMGLMLILLSCEVNKIPDVSNIDVDLNTIRFDKILFEMDTTDVKSSFIKIESEHKAFTDIFFQHILPLKTPSSKSEVTFEQNLSKFINDEFCQSLYDTTQIVYPDVEGIQKDVKQMLKYSKYHFPELNVNKVYTYISEFGYQTFLFSHENGDGLGIGLDLFLNDYPYENFSAGNPAFSAYITRTFNKEHIAKKAADAIIDDIREWKSRDRLLDKMIENGKKQILLKSFLPRTQDSILFEYSQEQMDWVNNNEFNIWAHLLDEELIYETNRKKIKTLLEMSPSSIGMPLEAPGRTANFIGYKILQKYLERNPEITLDSLINIQDPQFILDNSRYKPRPSN